MYIYVCKYVIHSISDIRLPLVMIFKDLIKAHADTSEQQPDLWAVGWYFSYVYKSFKPRLKLQGLSRNSSLYRTLETV